MISLSVSLPPLRSSTSSASSSGSSSTLLFPLSESHDLAVSVASSASLLNLLCIFVGLLLPTVALLEHILVPRNQGGQVAHRDVSAHLICSVADQADVRVVRKAPLQHRLLCIFV